jgi:triacylglycerol esterase/lipase EstA (alpha/beta hydrolase family)
MFGPAVNAMIGGAIDVLSVRRLLQHVKQRQDGRRTDSLAPPHNGTWLAPFDRNVRSITALFVAPATTNNYSTTEVLRSNNYNNNSPQNLFVNHFEVLRYSSNSLVFRLSRSKRATVH